jgi:hypothetical protein
MLTLKQAVGCQYSIRLWAGQEVTHPSSLRCTSMTTWCLKAGPDASGVSMLQIRMEFRHPTTRSRSSRAHESSRARRRHSGTSGSRRDLG